jgi:hypothetical protein
VSFFLYQAGFSSNYELWARAPPAAGFNHMVGIVFCGFGVTAQGETVPNNFTATAFLKHIRPRRG